MSTGGGVRGDAKTGVVLTFSRAKSERNFETGYHVSASNPNVGDKNETQVLTIAHPNAEHNGGMLQFGSDGFLYNKSRIGEAGGCDRLQLKDRRLSVSSFR